MIDFAKYAKIKDHYCLGYFGQADEYLVQLRLLKPILEKWFPGLTIYIGCKDDKAWILKDCHHIVLMSAIRNRTEDFIYVNELRCNGISHPIEDLLQEANVESIQVAAKPSSPTVKCVIVTHGAHPTKSLSPQQIDQLRSMAFGRGMSPEIDVDVTGAGLVMGVESFSLYEALASGIETCLVPTGVGTRLYKQMCPNPRVLHI